MVSYVCNPDALADCFPNSRASSSMTVLNSYSAFLFLVGIFTGHSCWTWNSLYGIATLCHYDPGSLYLSRPNHAWQSKISKSHQDRSAIPRLHTQTGTPSPASFPMRLAFLLLPCTILASTVSAMSILGRQITTPTCCLPCLDFSTNNVSLGGCAATDDACLCSSTTSSQGVINCFAYVMSHPKILLSED